MRWPTSARVRTFSTHLREVVDEALEEREKRYGAEVWAQVERLILLRTIDSLWVDHLTELDDMRRGIGLRGYGGIDPLNEFKREAFQLYEELRGFISRQVAITIFRVQVQQVPQQAQPAETGTAPVDATVTSSDSAPSGNGNGRRAARPAPPAAGVVPPALAAAARRGIQYQHGEADAPGSGPGAPSAKPASSDGPKLGRNDPCWCGSGKKYKRCHGA